VEKVLVWGREGIDDHRMMHYRQQIAGALQRQGSERDICESAAAVLRHEATQRIKPRRRAA
jgi:hypothetical protein